MLPANWEHKIRDEWADSKKLIDAPDLILTTYSLIYYIMYLKCTVEIVCNIIFHTNLLLLL